MYEQLSHQPEIHSQSSLLENLQAERLQHAQSDLEQRLRGHVDAPNRLANPRVALSQVELDGFGYDEALLSPANLMAFEAVGLSHNYMLEHTADGASRSHEPIPDVSFGSLTIKNEQYSEGVSLRITTNGPDGTADKARLVEAVKERFAASPAHRMLADVSEQARTTSQVSRLETAWFSPSEDGLGTLTALTDMGFFRDSHQVVRDLRHGKSAQQIIQTELATYARSDATVIESETTVALSWGGALERRISIDTASGDWRFSFETHPEQNYAEVANQSPSAESVPFLETDCARDILGWAESAGLTISPEFRSEMTRVGQADRYGSVYTQLSREIAKWVDSPSRQQLTNVFTPVEAHDSQTPDQQVADALARVDTSRMSEPAHVLLDIARQTVLRQSFDSSLPVTEEQIDIKDGACFDVFTYYVGAAAGERDWGTNNWLHETTVGDVRLLEKTHGNHTFMSTTEVQFNGVVLPKGALFQQATDGGFAFQRLTPFTFDEAVDQQAFGSEITKTYLNEAEAVSRIGGAVLRNLVVGAQR